MAPVMHLTKRLVGHGVLGKTVENLLAIQVIGLPNLVNSKKTTLWKVIRVTVVCIAISGLHFSHITEMSLAHMA